MGPSKVSARLFGFRFSTHDRFDQNDPQKNHRSRIRHRTVISRTSRSWYKQFRARTTHRRPGLFSRARTLPYPAAIIRPYRRNSQRASSGGYGHKKEPAGEFDNFARLFTSFHWGFRAAAQQQRKKPGDSRLRAYGKILSHSARAAPRSPSTCRTCQKSISSPLCALSPPLFLPALSRARGLMRKHPSFLAAQPR